MALIFDIRSGEPVTDTVITLPFRSEADNIEFEGSWSSSECGNFFEISSFAEWTSFSTRDSGVGSIETSELYEIIDE